LAGTVCTAPPTAGTASSSFASICGGGSVTISLNGNSIGAGQTYQWQSSPNNSTWGNISNTTTFFNTIITANIFYRCVVTCNGLSDTSTVASVALNPATLCYCVTGLGGGNCNGNLITTVEITGTSLNSVSADTCTFTTGNTLTVYPPSGSTTASLIQGIPYDLSVSLSASSIVSVWIDFNQDGTYSASEWTQVALTSTVGTPNTIQITVPFNSGLGLTGMRVRSRAVGNINGAPDACTNFGSGETEDYVITLVANVACSGAPNAGIANASISPVCPNISFSLSLSGSTLASGLSYQWQSSVNNTIWADITGATSFSYSTAQTTDTYYRCIVSCSSASDTSSFVFVPINSFFNCYCNSGANFTTLADIGNVTFGVLSNGVASPSLQNSSAVNTYTDFSNLPPLSYIQTLTYPISLTQISQTTFTASAGAVFIDYDHDGNFDPTTEEVLTGNTNAASFTISGNVTIPATALTGVTRMRVVLAQGTTPASPCGTYTWGETEDYLINILSPNSCAMPFIAGFAKSNTNLVCSSDNFTLSIDSLPPDTGFSFQWQRSLDSINWNSIPGATIQVYIGSQNFDSWYRCNVSCNGGTSVSSSTIKVINKPVTQCNYCNTTLSGNCSTNYYIDSLAIGGTTFNNAATGCAANAGFAYSKYPASGNTTASLARGNYYDLYVKTAGSCNISVWLDYDQSGTFDSTEWIQVSQATDSAVSARVALVIPAIGLCKLGTTGLRVRSRKAGNLNLGSDGCSPYGSGETEDYYVTLVDAISTGKELENDKNVKVYPNPSTGMLSIECKLGDTKTLQINIMSAGGRLIFAENNLNFKGTYKQTLDLTGFPKGIYFIQFISDKQVMNKKIVLN
jgi:GEVED domain/Secretion system C-terminal sorting domain